MTGRHTSDLPPSGFWFAGHHIVAAIMDELNAELTAATEIVVTGESAGGAAVYTNLDYIAGRFPQAATAGAAIAGFNNWAFPYTGPDKSNNGPGAPTWIDFRKPAWADIYDLWDPLINDECRGYYADYPATCLVECYKYKFIETPLFIFESQADSVNLAGHNSIPHLPVDPNNPTTPPDPPISAGIMKYLAGWHHNMSTCLAEITTNAPGAGTAHGVVGMHAAGKHGAPGPLNPADGNATLGVFNPSCYIHTGFTNEITIAGTNYKQAFRNFFYGTAVDIAPSAGPGGPGAPTILTDDCGELCNPSCNAPAPPPSPTFECVLDQCVSVDPGNPPGRWADPQCGDTCKSSSPNPLPTITSSSPHPHLIL